MPDRDAVVQDWPERANSTAPSVSGLVPGTRSSDTAGTAAGLSEQWRRPTEPQTPSLIAVRCCELIGRGRLSSELASHAFHGADGAGAAEQFSDWRQAALADRELRAG